jgi:hypothetical protein
MAVCRAQSLQGGWTENLGSYLAVSLRLASTMTACFIETCKLREEEKKGETARKRQRSSKTEVRIIDHLMLEGTFHYIVTFY